MERPPRSLADSGPQEARHQDRGEQVDGDDPQPDPQRPIARGERNDRGDDAQRGERVGDRRDDVDPEEYDGQERKAPMQLDAQEARPGRALPADDCQDAETDDRRE